MLSTLLGKLSQKGYLHVLWFIFSISPPTAMLGKTLLQMLYDFISHIMWGQFPILRLLDSGSLAAAPAHHSLFHRPNCVSLSFPYQKMCTYHIYWPVVRVIVHHSGNIKGCLWPILINSLSVSVSEHMIAGAFILFRSSMALKDAHTHISLAPN